MVVERGAAPRSRRASTCGAPSSPDALAIMGRLKREFDPEGVLNPGRFVGGL